MPDDLRDCWCLIAPREPPDPALDDARARFLGLLASRTDPLRFSFPVIRRRFKRPEEMSTEEAIAHMLGPIRKGIDYSPVGRRTFLVLDPLEIARDDEQKR